jgi:hypothetical protein
MYLNEKSNQEYFIKLQGVIRHNDSLDKSWEIRFESDERKKLPNTSGKETIKLKINAILYNSDLHIRKNPNTKYDQLSTVCSDNNGAKYQLSNLLKAEGYERNDKVLLHYFSEEKTFVLIKKIDK